MKFRISYRLLKTLVIFATIAMSVRNVYASSSNVIAGAVKKMTKERFTIVLLPPEEMARDIEAYARENVGPYATAANGETIYLLGRDPLTGEHRKAHCTVAQFDAEPDAFEAELPKLLAYLDQLHRDGLTINGTLTGVNFFPVPAGAKAYAPALDYATTWFDRDVARGGGVLSFNNKVIRFLATLDCTEKTTDPSTGDTIVKTINGVGNDGYRPHFTYGRGVLPVGAASAQMPAYTGAGSDLKPFPFRVALGRSKPTGEFVEMWGYYQDAKFVDVRAPKVGSTLPAFGMHAAVVAGAAREDRHGEAMTYDSRDQDALRRAVASLTPSAP